MNLRSRSRARAATFLLVAALGATAPFLTASMRDAVARPASKNKLEVWPGRRVVMVLPLTTASTFNSDPQLGQAILPLAQPQLQQAMANTGKFSVTLPYRFDPILRRAVADKKLTNDDVSSLLQTPSLETARAVTDKLTFDQPVMIAEVKIEELRAGGTAKQPTLQIQASGRLYEQGSPDAVRSVVVTSQPARGEEVGDRITAASADVFNQIAAQFVEPPAAFQLPLPTPVEPTPTPTAQGSAATPSATPTATPGSAPTPTTPPLVAPPNSLAPAPGTPFVPQLPAAQPPLGIAAGGEPTAG